MHVGSRRRELVVQVDTGRVHQALQPVLGLLWTVLLLGLRWLEERHRVHFEDRLLLVDGAQLDIFETHDQAFIMLLGLRSSCD